MLPKVTAGIVSHQYSAKSNDMAGLSLFASSTPLLCIPETLSNGAFSDNIEHQSVYNGSYVYYICLGPITWAYTLPLWAHLLHQRTRARAIAKSTVKNNDCRKQRGFSQDLNYFPTCHFQIFVKSWPFQKRFSVCKTILIKFLLTKVNLFCSAAFHIDGNLDRTYVNEMLQKTGDNLHNIGKVRLADGGKTSWFY